MLTGYNPIGGPNCDDLENSELYRCVVEEDYIPFPDKIQKDEPTACKLIHKLLERDPEERFQSATSVKKHKWFRGIDFKILRKQKIDAPWIPSGTVPSHSGKQDKMKLDTPHFDNLDYIENNPTRCFFKDSYPTLSPKEQAMFQSLET